MLCGTRSRMRSSLPRKIRKGDYCMKRLLGIFAALLLCGAIAVAQDTNPPSQTPDQNNPSTQQQPATPPPSTPDQGQAGQTSTNPNNPQPPDQTQNPGDQGQNPGQATPGQGSNGSTGGSTTGANTGNNNGTDKGGGLIALATLAGLGAAWETVQRKRNRKA